MSITQRANVSLKCLINRSAPLWVVYSQPMISRRVLCLLALILSRSLVCIAIEVAALHSTASLTFAQTESPVALPCRPMTSAELNFSKTLHGLLMWLTSVFLFISRPKGRTSTPTASQKLSIQWDQQQAMKRVCDAIASHSPERARKGYKQCTLAF